MNGSTVGFEENFTSIIDHEWWLASTIFSVLMSKAERLLCMREDLITNINELNKP